MDLSEESKGISDHGSLLFDLQYYPIHMDTEISPFMKKDFERPIKKYRPFNIG